MKTKMLAAVSIAAVCILAWFVSDAEQSSATVAAPSVEEAQVVESDAGLDSSPTREPIIEAEPYPDWYDPTIPDTPFEETAGHRVRVLDPDGEPIPHAEVVLTWPVEYSSASTDARAVRRFTDAAGIASLPVDGFVGDWNLVASYKDRFSSGVCTPASFPGGVRGDFDLQLYELVAVRGRVIDEAGIPVPTAEVDATPTGSRLFVGTPAAREGVVVDDQGRFTCMLEATGTSYEFRAERLGGDSCEASAVVGRDGAEEVVLRFSSTAEVSGVVLDEANGVVPGATVHLLRYDDQGNPTDRRKRRQAVTDDAGRFRFEKDPGGAWFLVATADGRCSSEPVPSTEMASATRSIVLRLAACTTISGEVVDGDGEPLEGVMIAAVTDLDREPERYELHGGDNELVYPLAFTESGADGGFRLEGIRSGNVPYRLMFIADSTQRDRVVEEHGVLPGTDDLRVVLTDERILGGVLEARITVEGKGEVLESGTLFLYERSLQGAWVAQAMRRFEGGLVRREGLEPGREYCASVQPVGSHLCALIPAWTAELGVHQVEVVMPRARLVTVPVPAEVATSGALEVIAVDPHPAEAAPWSAPIKNGVGKFHLRPGAYTARIAGEDAFDFEVTTSFVALSTGDR